MTKRGSALVIFALLGFTLLACPLGRKDNELGGECHSANDCPMGTTGLRCKDNKYCTKACTSDADCAAAKGGAMTCVSNECTRK